MSFVVKLSCRGTAMRTHPLRTVAEFRYEDGWARVRSEGQLDTVQEPTGDVRLRHRFECGHGRCTRDDVYTAEQLYPLLDEARKWGNAEVPLG
ncbi:hypothetical protein [Cryobacterium sp. CG_9.6]|uniref:hypothetical protein n=1 Tax=Cryobacterium sp. CG_9.6 TaxID=2760710 RepID=UPI0024744F72|nr:hypothetical protein [Cryobacterium sp. CG_9.6]MDH6236230.1 hypothetical protein [Cryobacterium sp. CG_9.6]